MLDGVTVRHILDQPEFAGSRVLAGYSGLDRTVASVTVAEIPDIAQWLNGGDFVHGVGRMFVDADGKIDEVGFCSWTSDLITAGAACLAIKTGRYIRALPPCILQLGEKFDFPIIELPDSMTQGPVAQVIYRLLLEQGRNREERRTQLFAQMMRDLSGPHVLQHDAATMASYLDHHIVITDKSFAFLGTSFTPDGDAVDLQAVSTAIRQTVESGQEIPENAALADQTVVESVFTDPDGREWDFVVIDITYHDKTIGYVAMIGSDISADQKYYFASLAEALTVDMSQSVMVETSALVARSELFSTLSAPTLDEPKARHLANLIGLDIIHPLTVAVIAIVPRGSWQSPTMSLGESEMQVVRYVSNYLESMLANSHEFYVATWQRGIVVMIAGDNIASNRLSWLLSQIVAGLRKMLKKSGIIAGIGTRETGIIGAHESAETALRALSCIETFSLAAPVMRYDQLGLFLFLESAVSSGNASRFVDFVLGELLHQESTYRDLLMETLSAFIRVNGSYAEVAKALNVHVNTVRYRIGKISELLPVDLSTADGRGALWLALRINTLLNAHPHLPKE